MTDKVSKIILAFFALILVFAFESNGQDVYSKNLSRLKQLPKTNLRDSLIVDNIFAMTKIVCYDLESWVDSLHRFSLGNNSKTGLLLWEIIDSEKTIRKLNFEEGIKKHLDFAKTLESSGQSRYASWSYLRAGIILARPSTPFIRKKDALTFYNKGLEIATIKKDTAEIIRANVYMGEYYLDIKNTKESLSYLTKADQLLSIFADKNLYPTVLASMGSCYLLNEKEDLAAAYFKKMDFWLDHNPFKFKDFYKSYINNIKFLGFANYYFDRKIYEKAAFFAGNGYAALQGFKILDNKRSYNTYVTDHLKILYQANAKIGKPNEAFRFLEEYQTILNENNQNELNQKLQELNTKYQTEQKEVQIKALENEKIISMIKTDQKTKYFLWAIIVFLLAFSSYVYYSVFKLKQKNQEISDSVLKGQTIERKRVAADLHDNLGSTLSSIKWSLEAIDKSKMDKTELAVHQNLSTMLENAYNEVRLLSHNLLPEEFEKQGLASALAYFVRRINQQKKIKFSLDIAENVGRLDKKVEFELYSICLELANNIIKHSKATEGKISLEKFENKLKLTIEDNGIGTFKNDSDGKGLKNVQARVDSLGGKWNIKLS